MKITKKTLEKMIRESLEDRFNVSEEAAPDVVDMSSSSLPGEVKRVLNIPRADEILASLADAIEAQKSPQIKANVYTLILQAIGLDTVDELQAFRSLIQTRLAKAESEGAKEAEIAQAETAAPPPVDSAADLEENKQFAAVLKKLVQQEIKNTTRK
tara:strand:+ start:3825 stop:4292 length:468 start_codon:yes stop_codon:yes gene_type:complete